MQAGRRPVTGSAQQASSYRENPEIMDYPSYCAFLPNNEANLPAYYEQTTARPETPSTKAFESSPSNERMFDDIFLII